MPDTDETQKINETLYQHNLEIALKNKTLSLLEKLYQKSILALSPEDMAQAIGDTIKEDLNLEMVGVLIFKAKTDSLVPLNFSTSDRLTEALVKQSLPLKTIEIAEVKNHKFFQSAVYDRKSNITNDLKDVWGKLISQEQLTEITKESHITTTLLYPLLAGGDVLGVLLLGLNRDYETLNDFEKSSIASFTNVIALSLSKAYLYQDLQDANEKLKALDKQKTEFVSLASHQLRSPLTAIKGYSSMILEGSFGAINDKAKEAIGRVFESSQKLVMVIEDFLNITRIELGRMKYDVTEFSFNKLVSNVIGEQKPNVERRGLTISYEEDAPEYKVFADMGKISQVISNLVDNSVKYSKEGSIKVKIVGIKGEDGKAGVRLSVTDTGVGIDPKVMPHLFAKFSRAADASKTNIIGTGLGLYVAKQIMDSHKGKIWAESAGAGQGSTFFVELALSTGVAPTMVTPPAEIEAISQHPEPPIPQPVAGDLS